MADSSSEESGNSLFGGIRTVNKYMAAAHFGQNLLRKLERFVVTTVDVADHDEAFQWIQTWLAHNEYAQKARLLTATTVKDSKSSAEWDGDIPAYSNKTAEGDAVVRFVPAPGMHLFRFHGTWVALTRERRDFMVAENRAYHESFTLRFYTRDRGVITELFEEAKALSVRPDQTISVYSSTYSDWYASTRRRPRPLDSVILDDGIAEDIVKDITDFVSRQSWYHERGVPHRRGYMLYGPPGNGKTSFIFALASELGYDLATLPLGSKDMTDDAMRRLMTYLPDRSLLLIEDIDSVFHGRDPVVDNGVTFSGLLNAIDGVAANEGRIMFMTTNKIEVLDDALIRAGRIDKRILVDNADRKRVIRMYWRFNPDGTDKAAEEFADRIGENVPMAAVQNALMTGVYDGPIVQSITLDTPTRASVHMEHSQRKRAKQAKEVAAA